MPDSVAKSGIVQLHSWLLNVNYIMAPSSCLIPSYSSGTTFSLKSSSENKGNSEAPEADATAPEPTPNEPVEVAEPEPESSAPVNQPAAVDDEPSVPASAEPDAEAE